MEPLKVYSTYKEIFEDRQRPKNARILKAPGGWWLMPPDWVEPNTTSLEDSDEIYDSRICVPDEFTEGLLDRNFKSLAPLNPTLGYEAAVNALRIKQLTPILDKWLEQDTTTIGYKITKLIDSVRIFFIRRYRRVIWKQK